MYTANQPYTPDRLIIRNRQYSKEFLRKPFTLITALSFVFSELVSLVMGIIFFAFTILISDDLNLYLKNITGSDSVQFSSNLNLTPPIGSILLIITFILLYSKSKDSDYRATPTAGATMFKVYSTVNLIAQSLGAVVLLLVPVIIAATLKEVQRNHHSYAYGIPDRVITVSVILASAFVLISVSLIIIKAASMRRFSLSVQESLTTEKLTHKGSTAFAVSSFVYIAENILISFLLAVVSFGAKNVLSTNTDTELFTIFSQFPFVAAGILFILYGFVSSLPTGFMAIFALRFRKHIADAGENGCNLPPLVLPYDNIPSAEIADNFPSVTEPSFAENAVYEASVQDESLDNQNPYAGTQTPPNPVESDNNISENSIPPKFCHLCGVPVTPEQRFCTHCGNKLN